MKKGLFLTILFLLGLVVGGFAQTTYYYTGTGALDNNANWGTTQGATDAPTSFTNTGNTLVITQAATTANNSSATWTVGATISVTGSSGYLTIAPSNAIVNSGSSTTSVINVAATSTLDIQNNTADATIGSLASTSTVIYDANGTQDFLLPITGATSTASGNYGNLIVGNTSTNPSTVVSIGKLNGLKTTIAGNLTSYSGSTLNVGNTTTVVSGNINVYGLLSVTPYCNGAIYQSPSTSIYSLSATNINVYGGGQITFSPGLATVGLTGILVSTLIHVYPNGTIYNPLNGAAFYGAAAITIDNLANLLIGNQFTIQSARARGFIRNTGTLTVGTTAPGPNVTILGSIDTYGSTGFPANVNNLTVALSTGFPLTLSKDVTVNGALTLTSGRLIVGNDPNNSNIAATLTLNGAIAGDLSKLVTYSTKSSIVLGNTYTGYTGLNGSSTPVLVVPTAYDSSHNLNNLTIQTGTSGSPVLLTNNTTSSNLSIAGTLNLTAGYLQVGSNTLTLNGFAISPTASTNLLTTSSSNLVFGGSASSVYIPSSVTALNKLTINNASGVTLNGPTTVNGTLTLTNGALNTASTNLLSLVGGSSTTNIGSNSAYVNRPIQWNIPSGVSATSYYYPIGNLGVYAPFSLNNVTTTAASTVQVQVTHGATGGSANLINYLPHPQAL